MACVEAKHKRNWMPNLVVSMTSSGLYPLEIIRSLVSTLLGGFLTPSPVDQGTGPITGIAEGQSLPL